MRIMQGKTFIFFGLVGSGKGTQVQLLTDVLKAKDDKEVVLISPGNEYRKLIASGTYVGNRIKDSMERGELQPDSLTNALVGSIILSQVSSEKHMIADGYPRRIAQSQMLYDMCKFFERKDIKVIYIKLSEEEAMKRNLLRGRHDDTEEGLRKRFEEYRENVIPAMEYFKDKEGYEFCEINGEQSVEDVHKDIIKALNL